MPKSATIPWRGFRRASARCCSSSPRAAPAPRSRRGCRCRKKRSRLTAHGWWRSWASATLPVWCASPSSAASFRWSNGVSGDSRRGLSCAPDCVASPAQLRSRGRVRLLAMPARPLPRPSLADPRILGSVLVVEEHDGVRSALRDWLLTSFPPLRLREARSMEEALRLADQAQLDLILVNLELPGPNGIEATRALRKRHPDCPVVVMSVTDSEALRLAAAEAGAAAFVSKRELPSTLLPILDRLLR